VLFVGTDDGLVQISEDDGLIQRRCHAPTPFERLVHDVHSKTTSFFYSMVVRVTQGGLPGGTTALTNRLRRVHC
jgi:hypothetical protein